MNPKLLTAMIGRKSATFVSGFCACAWVHSQWPEYLDNPASMMALAAMALLAVSGVSSWKNETKKAGE